MPHTITQCPVCGGMDSFQVAEERCQGNVSRVSRCRGCGALFTSYQDRDHNLNYQEHDERSFQGKYGPILRGERLHDRHRNYLEEVEVIRRHAPAGGRYLDVGCHAGWLLGYVQRGAPGLKLYGLEPSRYLANLTAERLGIRVFNDFVRPGVFEGETFDFISLTDVFEHIPNPNEVLRVLHDALNPRGRILIKIPNGEFTLLKHRLRKVLGFMILARDVFDAKEHYVHYGRKSLTRALERSGFRMVELIVPLPVQTRHSNPFTVAARWAVYALARAGLFPPQDYMAVAKKI